MIPSGTTAAALAAVRRTAYSAGGLWMIWAQAHADAGYPKPPNWFDRNEPADAVPELVFADQLVDQWNREDAGDLAPFVTWVVVYWDEVVYGLEFEFLRERPQSPDIRLLSQHLGRFFIARATSHDAPGGPPGTSPGRRRRVYPPEVKPGPVAAATGGLPKPGPCRDNRRCSPGPGQHRRFH